MATDERLDELISTWLQESAPAQMPQRVLEDAAERTRVSRQQVRWRARLGWFLVPRSVLAIGTTAAVMVAAVLVLSPRLGQPEVGQLPTTPDAWSGVPIDSRWTTAQVDGLVAGPRGLLAILGELGSSDMQLSVSTDGRTWTLVPNDQFPSPGVLWPHSGVRHLPAVVTTSGFLFVAEGNDVWASGDGYTWQRRADRAQDADLRAGAILAVAAGGPGLVAVGSDNKAWTSEDGSDWTLAEVPAPPTASFEGQGLAPPTVFMQGIAARGETFVAWGTAVASDVSDGGIEEPVLWTSDDGRRWAEVPDVSGLGSVHDVAAGPNGYVAIVGTSPSDTGGILFSTDGRAWHPVDNFEEAPGPIDLSIAATGAGYVAVGGEGLCAVEPCPNAVAAIWASPDGRSWSRLLSDDLFTVADPRNSPNHSGAWATSVVARDDHFVVAGAYDASPVVWISGTPSASEAPVVTPVASSDPGEFLGIWVSTSDGDGGTQTMTVEPSADASVEIVVTDTIATVCSGTPSKMTGSGSVEGVRLVIPAPDYRCDDGTQPQPMGGPGLNDELRNLTYTHDAVTDTLSVGIGDVWVRARADAPTPAPQPSDQAPPPVEPTATSTPPLGPPASGTPIGWSTDGTRILIEKDDQNLVLRHVDGSETLVTEQPSEYERFGSARPTGATISPDGSRVIFAGLTTTDGLSCHHGALFAVNADGGSPEVLWESQAASDGGIVRDPTFSPDGTQIAFADGYCDSNHSVWVMNADGSDAHQIVTSDVGPLGATHVHGLAWSAAGDRMALMLDDGMYTFATDGSDFRREAAPGFCWPGREC